jgi:hypothetical protein
MRLPHPRRRELGPIGHDQQHRQLANVIDDDVEELPRRGIDPVRVFQDHQHGPARGESGKLHKKAPQQQLLAALEAERQRGMALVGRDREKVGKERDIVAGLLRR